MMQLLQADPITGQLERYLDDVRACVTNVQTCTINGRLLRATGMVLQASGPRLPIGATARIEQEDGRYVEAEVVGFDGDALLLMPSGETHGMRPGASVALPVAEKALTGIDIKPPVIQRAAAPQDMSATEEGDAQALEITPDHRLRARVGAGASAEL